MAIRKDFTKEIPGGVCAAKGYKVASTYSGIRKSERDDLLIIVSDRTANCAGVLTTNQVKAWCIQHNAERLKAGRVDVIVSSAGNANACNGLSGKESDLRLAKEIKAEFSKKGREIKEVLTASTGVIGRELQIEKLLVQVPYLVDNLGYDGDRAAKAIMTTDLVPKSYALEVNIGHKTFVVGGIAKGSGMIAPNMATMFGFITTDLEVPIDVLREELKVVADRSFNAITVDGDTSTNDMLLVMANGEAGIKWEEAQEEFHFAFEKVCQELAKMIARDGEGATKLVHVKVSGAESEADCKTIAKTIAESPLVKTACFGNDPNWGRILAAAGRSGVALKPEQVSVSLAGIEIFRAGEPTNYDIKEVSSKMKVKDLEIKLDFIAGSKFDATCWTCDFSYDYVKINAEYTT